MRNTVKVGDKVRIIGTAQPAEFLDLFENPAEAAKDIEGVVTHIFKGKVRLDNNMAKTYPAEMAERIDND